MDKHAVAAVVGDRIAEALGELEKVGLFPDWITAGLELALVRRKAERPGTH